MEHFSSLLATAPAPALLLKLAAARFLEFLQGFSAVLLFEQALLSPVTQPALERELGVVLEPERGFVQHFALEPVPALEFELG
mmetsp:Transcript_15460/g.41506  ORF Transcript_15460/g.41506 Transcript_15460/m.41506 type:complete len:83 (+) Transcript_15460:917-1165(+)